MIKTINDIQIDTPYKFKKFGVDEDAYIRHLLMIKDIQNTSPSLVTELFKYKFKNHIKDFFHIDITNIPDNYLYQFCKELIEVNHKHVQSNKIKESIRVDNNQLRSAIEQKKKELRNKQIALIKDRYRYNSLLCLSKNGKEANEVLNNLQKLERMLHWRRPSLIANYMTEIDYNLILKAMPFWISEVRNLGQILPMRSGIFDLVIVDESSQVNLAEILPALYRGNQIVVVGDHHQLGLDSTGVNFRLSNRFDNLIWNKNFNNNGISYAVATEKKLTVTKCSILDFINSPENKDTIRSRMLNEHYRSMPLLAKYTNANFYKGELKVMTETPKNINKDCFKVIEVSGERDKNDTTILTEAKEVVSIIKQLTNSNSDIIDFDLFDISRNDFSIGVISLMTNQRQLIADLIDDEIDEDVVIKHNIDVWTPQSAQGNERDIIIISICLDINCTGKGNYYKNDRLLNVATSRAKKFTFVVHSNFQKNKYEKLGKYVNLEQLN